MLAEILTVNPDSEHDSIISEDERKDCVTRWKEQTKAGFEDWDYIFQPIRDAKKRNRLIDVLKVLSRPE